MEAVILAGGLGLRLREISDQSKPMNLIGDKPFLSYQLDYLIAQGVTHVIMAIGYKAETISSYFGQNYKSCKIDYKVETEPLGTGGAIFNALENLSEEQFWIMNGDTYFKIDMSRMWKRHNELNSDITIALKSGVNNAKYGVVECDGAKIVNFSEKKSNQESSKINGGIYLARRAALESLEYPEKFSFEIDFLQKETLNLNINGYCEDAYFIDIGSPKDLERAKEELRRNV